MSENKNISYAPEVIADSSGKWCGNALRFATQKEAEENVRDLMYRWFAVRETRVVPSTDAVNYAWVDGKLQPVKAYASEELVARGQIQPIAEPQEGKLQQFDADGYEQHNEE